jgi:hypothetical protein
MAKKSLNEVIMKMKEKSLASYQKVGLFTKVRNVKLWMMLGCSLQAAM